LKNNWMNLGYGGGSRTLWAHTAVGTRLALQIPSRSFPELTMVEAYYHFVMPAQKDDVKDFPILAEVPLNQACNIYLAGRSLHLRIRSFQALQIPFQNAHELF
jgi:hypothetical protein